MNVTITPGKLRGSIRAIPSKSQAHRLLICAAFGSNGTELSCPATNADIEATTACLNALSANITRTQSGYRVEPAGELPKNTVLPCGESGSTLRFLLPVAGALGVDATFRLEGRLPQRPLSPLWEELERMGCSLSRPTADTVRICGKLKSGDYSIAANISSQYVSGLLFALPLLNGDSSLELTGTVESKPYITMTVNALNQFSFRLDESENRFSVPGNQKAKCPENCPVEGDWSNGAFFLAANAMGSEVELSGLLPDSPQGDRAVAEILPKLERHCTVDCTHIPDLVPILAVTAAAKQGALFTGVRRLRLKESDRLQTVAALLSNLGGKAVIGEDTLEVMGTGLIGGTVDAAGDHRIAMAAAIASTVCTEPVTIVGAEAVQKSYPAFWDHFTVLGGKL